MADDINRSIIDRFSRIGRCMRRRMGDEHKGHFSDLTMLQLQALMYVKHHREVKMSELSEALGISPSSASLLVDRLAAAGWLERSNDSEDRRVVYLQLAARIRKRFEQGSHAKMNRLDEMLNKLPEADRRELDRILAVLEGTL